MLSVSTAYSQNLAERNWFFGNPAKSIQFNRPDFQPSQVTNSAIPFGSGGGAVATDAITGNLLFYTDGNRVYDVTGQEMSITLGGNTNLNQAATICPVPGAPNKYYIFTITAAGNLVQAIVDMTANGNAPFNTLPLGDVSISPPTGLANRSEAMIIIPHANGEDSWLITQPTNVQNTYTVTHITSTGLSSPQDVDVTIGGTVPVVPLTAANFAYQKSTKKLAVSPGDIGKNVELFTFDNATGSLVFNSEVLESGALSTTIYDVEWSINGDYLYVSRNKTPAQGEVVRIDLTANPVVSPSTIAPPPAMSASFGLQMGPDSVIYHLYQNGGNQFLGKIGDTDSIASKVIYTTQALPGTVAKQFSSFSPPAKTTYTLSFTTAGTCTNSPITFFPAVTPTADSIVWDFGDGTIVTSWSPVHTFTTDVNTVKASAYVNGVEVISLTQLLPKLDPLNLQLSLQSDTTACSCELKYPKIKKAPCRTFNITPQSSGGNSPTYQWYGPSGLLSTKTSLTLSGLDSAGYYYVIATDGNCSVSAGQQVKEYNVQDQRANIWHFGNGAGINFNPLFYTNPQSPLPISSPINTDEGVAVICDDNGQIIFSTDGNLVYDRAGNLIAGVPTAPPTNSATQSALIIPVPGDETLYYIFSTDPIEDGTYNASYMLFDLKKGSLGGIVGVKNTLFAKSTERLTGNDNWLIAHDYGNNSFRAYEISAEGISAPVITDIGSVHSTTSLTSTKGYMVLGPRNLLAVALSDGTNKIELFDFIDSTGVVTNYRPIILPSTDEVYGIEFSPGGNKLYATVKGATTSSIYEYTIDDQGVPSSLPLQVINVPGQLGAMQTGPDGQVYITVDGSTSLLHFTPNDALLPTPVNTDFTNLLTQTFSLTVTKPMPANPTSTLGLPNFIQTLGEPQQQPSISVVGQCVNTPVVFSATPSDDYRDEFIWTVTQNNNPVPIISSNEQSFEHTFNTPGTYKVHLEIFSDCLKPGVDTVRTFNQDLIIFSKPAKPTFLAATENNILCTLDKKLYSYPPPLLPDPTLTYLWTTAETSNEITITQPGTYGVTVTNTNSCTASDSIDIFDNRPVVDLGPDFPLCKNESRTLNAGNPGSSITYKWKKDIVIDAGSSQLLNVNTSDSPGTHSYEVTVTDANTTCSASDNVLVELREIPSFTTATTSPGCGLTNGTVRINLTAGGPDTYAVIFNGAIKSAVPSSGFIVPDYTPLAAGSYPITITNNRTHCQISDFVGLSNSTFQITPVAPLPTCTPVPAVINHTLVGVYSISYTVINKVTGTIVVSGTGINNNPFFTGNIGPGSYIIEAIESGCKSYADIIVPSNPPAIFTLSQDCKRITATTAITDPKYNWTGPPGGITSQTNLDKVTLAPSTTGTITVVVSDNSNTFCPSEQSILVNIGNDVDVDFSPVDPCANPLTLAASPVGNYIYTWTDDSNNNFLGSGQKLIINTSTRVTLNVKGGGCDLGIFTNSVNLNNTVTLSLSSALPCEGQPFSITATPDPISTIIPSLQWLRNNKVVSGSSGNPLQTTVGGSYKATATINGCAVTSDVLPVGILPFDPANLPPTAYICDDPENEDVKTNQITLDPGYYETYEWFKNGITLNVNTPTFVVTDLGVFSVVYTNNFGCEAEAETEVLRDCRPRITGPNAFRPGGLNTNFFLYTFFISDEDFHIFIFNRWGEMVYQSDDREFKWNGTLKGNGATPLPPGMYSWVVKYKSSYRSKGIEEQHGGVLLMR